MRTRRNNMLRITPVSIEIVRMLQPMIAEIRTHNPRMANQLDDASTSVAANICEGNGHRGGARRHKYEIALGEARETVAWIQMAEAKQYAQRPAGIDAHLNHVIGTLVNVTR
jgi:four helix bundle protein